MMCCCVATLAGSASGATLSVTPSAVSNTYDGVLTLQVDGLTNGEQVIIQRYLDGNGNGVVDNGELLIDAFRIRDGGVSIIGGVTNLNVPYDSNPATGAITATISFAVSLESIVGRHLFRLVSPTTNFSPQTTLFVVTNAALAQSVSGTVFNGASPVANAVVVALAQPNNNFAGAVVADAGGQYLLKLRPGAYGLIPVRPDYYTDQSIAALVTLTNGASASANLFLTNGSMANVVSGQVYDATNGNTLGGVFLQFDAGNLFAVAFTDKNGSYSAALSADSWRARPESDRLARRAYVAPQGRVHVDLTAGSVGSIDFALPKANALFYGRIADNFNVPFANIGFFADDNNQFKANGFSDTNGNYAVAVLGGTGEWNSSPSISDNAALVGYLVSSGIGGIDIQPGQAVHQDFVAARATAEITGSLRDNLGRPVAGVSISGSARIGGIDLSSAASTDGAGNYLLPAADGTWSVFVNCCGGDGLDSFGLYDPANNHVVSIPPENAVLDITVYPIGTPLLGQPARNAPNQIGFSLSGSIGSSYTIQASTNLSGSNWFDLFTINLSSSGMFLQDNQATNQQRFYRARKN